MSESSISKEFIEESRTENKSKLWIKKVIDPLENGVPDIQAIYQGIPIFFESKLINSISLVNKKPFTKIQLFQLEERAKAGAICLGLLLFKKDDVRYVWWNEIPNDGYITKSQFLSAEKFSWKIVKSLKEKMENSL